MVKLRSWAKSKSVLGISYDLFRILTGEGRRQLCQRVRNTSKATCGESKFAYLNLEQKWASLSSSIDKNVRALEELRDMIAPLVHICSENVKKLTFGREILYMDGKLDVKQRQISINSLNDPKSDVKVLLASIKACSEGISLIGASRVVLLDVLWNPSVEQQAISRAYRTGPDQICACLSLSGDIQNGRLKRREKEELRAASVSADHTCGKGGGSSVLPPPSPDSLFPPTTPESVAVQNDVPATTSEQFEDFQCCFIYLCFYELCLYLADDTLKYLFSLEALPQIPQRTNSAPPNMDEQKRIQARSSPFRPQHLLPSSAPHQPQQREDTRETDEQKSWIPQHSLERDLPVQPHGPVQFGMPGAQVQHQGIPCSSFPMPMPLPVGNPNQVRHPPFVPGLQPHHMHLQGAEITFGQDR
ncbi:hypothetical protein HAX54_010822 [Datura stramonium]|uniref:Helicase C-terminal domain-containing protein n=1 Tax=Datura stramonium TaxID=4076 RepID=A0ABS8TGY2_DATST|nr:hypothetical protein [Datura stramonium]